MANIKLLMGKAANISNASNIAGQLLFTTDQGGHIHFDTDGTAAGRIELYADVIADLDALSTLVGSKSVATQIQDAIDKLTGSTGGDDATATLLASVVAGDGIEVDDTDESNPIVSVKLRATDNILKKDSNGALYVDKADAKDYTVTIDEKTTGLANDVAKAYEIKQEASGLDVTINIPKDMVVSDGKIVTADADGNAGTFIELTLANNDGTKLYIDVQDLVDEYTADNATDAPVVVTVTSDHKISADLSAAAKASLALADSAVQPDELKKAAKPGYYISAINVAEDGTITIDQEEVKLEWGSFDSVSSD